jgi:hypothetical protein
MALIVLLFAYRLVSLLVIVNGLLSFLACAACSVYHVLHTRPHGSRRSIQVPHGLLNTPQSSSCGRTLLGFTLTIACAPFLDWVKVLGQVISPLALTLAHFLQYKIYFRHRHSDSPPHPAVNSPSSQINSASPSASIRMPYLETRIRHFIRDAKDKYGDPEALNRYNIWSLTTDPIATPTGSSHREARIKTTRSSSTSSAPFAS